METETDSLLPVCVDLDSALVKTNLCHEAFVHLITSNPLHALKLASCFLLKRPSLRQELLKVARLDVTLLPYRAAVIDFVRKQRLAGHDIYLIGRNDELSERVSAHLGLFNGHISVKLHHESGSPGESNALTQRFGDQRFIYVGGSSADLSACEHAREYVLVGQSRIVQARLAGSPNCTQTLDSHPATKRELLKAIRSYQWVKNLLVFVPGLLAHELLEPKVFLAAVCIFIAMSLAASGVYITNDIVDLEADRRHPRKRSRPFASGQLPLIYGLLGPTLIVLAVASSFLVNPLTALTVLLYVSFSSAYSFVLKTLPLTDVFCLALLYTLRIVAGGAATGVQPSIWLLTFSAFFFLGLAFLKRSAELQAANVTDGQTSLSRRGYTEGDNFSLQTMGITSSFVSTLVLALYVDSNAASSNYVAAHTLWALVPLLLFWQCRLWLSTSRGYMHDDPIVYASRDWVSRCVAALMGAVYVTSTQGWLFA